MIIFSSSGETSFSTCRSGDVSTGGAVTDALYIGLRRLPGFSSNVAGRFRLFPVLVVPAGAWLVAGTYWALLSSYKDSMLLLLILFRIFSPIGLVGVCVCMRQYVAHQHTLTAWHLFVFAPRDLRHRLLLTPTHSRLCSWIGRKKSTFRNRSQGSTANIVFIYQSMLRLLLPKVTWIVLWMPFASFRCTFILLFSCCRLGFLDLPASSQYAAMCKIINDWITLIALTRWQCLAEKFQFFYQHTQQKLLLCDDFACKQHKIIRVRFHNSHLFCAHTCSLSS